LETPKNVLICEDDPVQLKILTALIDQAGYRSLTARSPGEALVAARRCGVDAVLADVQLQDGNAFDLMGDLRRFGFDAPVLMASAYATEGMKDRARRAGALRFFEKPFDLRKIKEGVDEAIQSVKKLDASVLIVDGHSKVRAQLEKAAVGVGFDAVTAVDGVQALEALLAKDNQIRIMIMDLHAPGSSGATLIQKALEIDPKLHVVMMSGDASRDEIRAGYEAGAASLIRKPIAAHRIGNFLVQSYKASRIVPSRAPESRRSKGWIWALAMGAAALLIGMAAAFGLQNLFAAYDRYEAKADQAMQAMTSRLNPAKGSAALEQIQLMRKAGDAQRRFRSDMPEFISDRAGRLSR
jgi:DNA-binding NtrC family response regulator